jgi:hypothetical protein
MYSARSWSRCVAATTNAAAVLCCMSASITARIASATIAMTRATPRSRAVGGSPGRRARGRRRVERAGRGAASRGEDIVWINRGGEPQ